MKPRSIPPFLFCLTALASFFFSEPRAFAGAIVTAYSRDVITKINLTPGIANNITYTATSSTSSDLARLDSAGQVSNSAALDPAFAAVGPNAGAVKRTISSSYGPHLATGDAVIAQNLQAASNQGLVNLSKGDNGLAFGINDIYASFTLKKADALTISFTAAGFLQAFIAVGALAPSEAKAAYVVDVDITQVGGTGDDDFVWKPNGVGTGITGGTVLADPFSLNKEIDIVASGLSSYVNNAANFSAVTNMLAAGDYRLTFQMSEDAFATTVPEPSTLAMLVIGSVCVGPVLVPAQTKAKEPILTFGC